MTKSKQILLTITCVLCLFVAARHVFADAPVGKAIGAIPGTFMVETTAGPAGAKPLVNPSVYVIGGRSFLAGKLTSENEIIKPEHQGKMCYIAIDSIVSIQEMP